MRTMNNYIGQLLGASFLSWFFSLLFIEIPPISDVAGCFSILTALGVWFIQYPNIKKRMKETWRHIKYFFTKS
jgi:hypothetical protein